MPRQKNQNRRGRVNEAVKEALAVILREVKDPRIDLSVSVLRAEVSNDLNYAKVYYSVLGDESKKEEVGKALESARGFIRKELARALDFRKTPELTFLADDSMEYSMMLEEKFREIREMYPQSQEERAGGQAIEQEEEEEG